MTEPAETCDSPAAHDREPEGHTSLIRRRRLTGCPLAAIQRQTIESLALLASCRDEADKEATKERWEGVLEGSHLRIGYPRLRRLGTAAANKAFSASAILMPIEMGKNGARPKHILVRTKDGYRAFTKYDPEICAALQEVLRKSMP